MWWIQLIQAVVQMGLAKADQDREEDRREAYGKMARAEGGAAADLAMEEAQRTRGRAATLAAASGGGITGSALDILDDLGRQSRFKARSAIYSAETDAQFGSRVSGQAALAGGALNAATPLLSEWSTNWSKKSGTGEMAGSLVGSLGGSIGAGAATGSVAGGIMSGMGGMGGMGGG